MGQSKEDIVQLFRAKSKFIVIIDEAYVDFGAYSCLELLENIKISLLYILFQNLVLLQVCVLVWLWAMKK